MNAGRINQYDLVEVLEVPEKYLGMIEVGDIGIVVEKHDDRSYEVECIQPGGIHKWTAILNVESIGLKSRDPFDSWAKDSLAEPPIMNPSVRLGMLLGGVFGALMGAGLGAITQRMDGVYLGLIIGLILGVVSGACTAALTVIIAGRNGGVGVGYFTGMMFGGTFGMVLGLLLPTSLRMSAQTEGLPILDALVMGRFEAATLISFSLSILDTIVGVWIGGRNQVPRNLKERYRS